MIFCISWFDLEFFLVFRETECVYDSDRKSSETATDDILSESKVLALLWTRSDG